MIASLSIFMPIRFAVLTTSTRCRTADGFRPRPRETTGPFVLEGLSGLLSPNLAFLVESVAFLDHPKIRRIQ
jgi:hypothetical protein